MGGGDLEHCTWWSSLSKMHQTGLSPVPSALALPGTGVCVWHWPPRGLSSASALHCCGETFGAASSDLKLLQTLQCWAASISAPLILLPDLLLGLLFATSVVSSSAGTKKLLWLEDLSGQNHLSVLHITLQDRKFGDYDKGIARNPAGIIDSEFHWSSQLVPLLYAVWSVITMVGDATWFAGGKLRFSTSLTIVKAAEQVPFCDFEYPLKYFSVYSKPRILSNSLKR